MTKNHNTSKLDSSTCSATNYVADRNQIVDVPYAKFTFPAPADARIEAVNSRASREIRPADSNNVASEVATENVARSEPELTDLNGEIYDITEMGIFRRRRRSSYAPERGVPECCPFSAGSYGDDLAEAVVHTREAVEFYIDYLGRRCTPPTVRQTRRHLEDLFGLAVYSDPVLGLMRPLTLPELVQRDGGRLLFFHLQEQFEDLGLGAVGNDKLAALRKFTRFIVKTALLPSGTNLRKRWGPVLVAPIEDREIEKRAVRSKVDVPSLELMPFVYEATCDWEEQPRRRSLSAPTIGCLTRTAFGSGARGVELRNLTLQAQSFNRSAGVYALPGWLLLPNAKTGGTRRGYLDAYGEAQLKDYLANDRPLISDDPLGFFFPNERGGQLSKASLSSATKPLLDYLKSKGLVCSTFTFHATRKTFATQFIEGGGSISALIEQCGWKSTAQLAVYLCESRRMRERQEEQWLRTCEPWRAA